MKLSEEEVNSLLSNWDIGKLISYKKSTKGESNHNWVVQTKEGKFILRRAPNFRKLKDLRFELFYLTKLKEKGFPYRIPAPLKAKNGNVLIKYNNGNWWLYKYIEGEVVEPLSLRHISELAKMMAIYHLTIEKMNVSNGKPKTTNFDIKTTINDLEKLLKKTRKIKNKKEYNKLFIIESGKFIKLMRFIKSKVYDSLPQYPLHRDLNPENVLWKNNKLVGIIDFENVGTMNENFITDIAIALMFAATTEKEHRLNLKMATKFIKSYNLHRKLSLSEINLIPEIITIGWIGAFSWQYWLKLHDPERSQIHRLKLYSDAAQWTYNNSSKIKSSLGKIFKL